MTKRIIAISVIFVCSWVAWGVLTLVVNERTDDKSGTVSGEVGQLWGSEHTQAAPSIRVAWETELRREVKSTPAGWEYMTEEEETEEEENGEESKTDDVENENLVATACVSGSITKEVTSRKYIKEKIKNAAAPQKKKKGEEVKPEKVFEVIKWRHTCQLPLAATKANVDLDVDYRKRGLLWFSTYKVGFDSLYTVQNPFPHLVGVSMTFAFPSPDAIYDNMTVSSPGNDDVVVTTNNGQMVGSLVLKPNEKRQVAFRYKSRGMNQWSYRFGSEVKMIKNFELVMRTGFDKIDFPMGSISPDSKKMISDGSGWQLVWKKDSLVSGLKVGMLMPQKINPGPLAAAMSIHAPVSLFFFFFVIFILQILRDLKIHPMNYFFIAASFFAFNLLFSYLVDHLNIFVSFGVSSAVSILLVVSYLRLVVHARFALVEAGFSQLIYQVLFSLAHFLEGYTGLTITIGAIITLAVVMRLTARLDWEAVFNPKIKPKNTITPEPAPANARP